MMLGRNPYQLNYPNLSLSRSIDFFIFFFWGEGVVKEKRGERKERI